MRLILASLLAVAVATGLLAAPVPKEKEKAKEKDEDVILGKWKTETVARAGGRAPGAGVSDRTYTFAKDGKLTLDLGGQEAAVEYKLDPSASPKTIDLIMKADAQTTVTIPGLYELDGDTLTICLCESSKPTRPTEMKAEGKGVGLLKFKRVKEEKKDK
jgi:uncharacterized protein (TIGR03067 family)